MVGRNVSRESEIVAVGGSSAPGKGKGKGKQKMQNAMAPGSKLEKCV